MSVTRMLPVVLTEPELRDRGTELAEKVTTFEALDSRRKADAKAAKEELDELRLEVVKLSRIVGTRKEDRPVEVVERFDTTARLVLEIRTDTGDQVSSRPMTLAELEEHQQRELPFAREEREAKSPKKKAVGE